MIQPRILATIVALGIFTISAIQPATAQDQPGAPKPENPATPTPEPDAASVTPVAGEPPAMHDATDAAKNVATIAPGETVAILGKKVVGPDGKQVMGPITDVLVGSDGVPRAVVIDFGGFVGVGSRRVALDWQSLKIRPDNPDAPLLLAVNPEDIKTAPEYKDPKAPTPVVEAPAAQGAETQSSSSPQPTPPPNPPAPVDAGK